MAKMADASILGSMPQYHHPPFSDESFEKAVSFTPRPNDVVIATPPKTGNS